MKVKHQYLRDLRIEHGDRLYDMAKKLGLSSATLSGIENGRIEPDQTFFKRLAQCYDLSPEKKKDTQKKRDTQLVFRRLLAFLSEPDDIPDDMTDAEIRKDLKAQGVNVDAFLNRVRKTIRRAKSKKLKLKK